MFRSALRRARNALQPLATGARASAACVERRALATLCASGGADLAAVGRASPVAAVQAALRRDIHFSSLLRDDAADGDDAAKGLYQVLGEELEHERSTYVPSEIVAAGPPAPFELIERTATARSPREDLRRRRGDLDHLQRSGGERATTQPETVDPSALAPALPRPSASNQP